MNKQLLLLVSAVIGSSATLTVEKGWINFGIHWSVAPQLTGSEGTVSEHGSTEYVNLPSFTTDYYMLRSDMSMAAKGWGSAFRATCSSKDSSGDCHLFYSLGSKEPAAYKRKLIAHGFEEGSCAPTANSLFGTKSNDMTTFYLRLPVGHQIEFFVLMRHQLQQAVVFNHQDDSDWVCNDKSFSECSDDLYPSGHIHAGAPLCIWSGVGCERNWCPVSRPTEDAPGDDIQTPEDVDDSDDKDSSDGKDGKGDNSNDDSDSDDKDGKGSGSNDDSNDDSDSNDGKDGKGDDNDDDDNDDDKDKRHRKKTRRH